MAQVPDYQGPPQPRPAIPAGTVQIEATAKRWKVLQGVGAVLFVPFLFISIIALIRYRDTESGASLALALTSAFVCGFGGVMYGWGRIGAWWHHG